MEVENTETGTVDTVGNILGDTLQLKLIKHYAPDNSMISWEYLWRNVYSLSLGSATIDLDYLNIDIFEGNPLDSSAHAYHSNHQDGYPFIQILGLDQYDGSANPLPDGKADVFNNHIVDPDQRLLIFPSRTPFADSTLSFIDDSIGIPIYLAFQVPNIYTKSYYHIATQMNSRYFIKFSLGLPCSSKK
jgi:cell surface protein SprA